MIALETRISNFLGAASFIADKNRQYRAWIDTIPINTSIISPDELYCIFFDDNDIDNFIERDLQDSPLPAIQKKQL